MQKRSRKASKSDQKGKLSLIHYIIIGALSGFVSGFFGAGGGVVLVFALTMICKNKNTANIFAMTAAVTAVFSVVSAVVYGMKGNLPFGLSLRYVIPAAIGGAIGAYLLGKVKVGMLKLIFALTVITAGGIMIFR